MFLLLFKILIFLDLQNSLWFEMKQQLFFATRCCKYHKVPVELSPLGNIATEETQTTLLQPEFRDDEKHRMSDDSGDKFSDKHLVDRTLPIKEVLLLQNGDQNNAKNNKEIITTDSNVKVEKSSEV